MATCHSRLWTDDEGCITAIDAAGDMVRTTPTTTAVIGRHNSVRLPDGRRDETLERFFADEVEVPVAPVLARLGTERERDRDWERHLDRSYLARHRGALVRDGFDPPAALNAVRMTAADRAALARYIGSLLVRVPSYKDEINSPRVAHEVAGMLGIDADQARLATDQLHVDIVREHVLDYGERLAGCTFVLIDSAREQFVFGDTPVVPAALGFWRSRGDVPARAHARAADRAWLEAAGRRSRAHPGRASTERARLQPHHRPERQPTGVLPHAAAGGLHPDAPWGRASSGWSSTPPGPARR